MLVQTLTLNIQTPKIVGPNLNLKKINPQNYKSNPNLKAVNPKASKIPKVLVQTLTF
jgi:hypothetical protein